MKYKAGDKVRVRKDLVAGKRYGCYPAVSKMVEKSGKIATIRTVHSDFYEIYKDVYSWTDEMFEPVEVSRHNNKRSAIPQGAPRTILPPAVWRTARRSIHTTTKSDNPLFRQAQVPESTTGFLPPLPHS